MTGDKKRRRYDEAFKRQAVRKLMECGKPVATVALSIGIDRTNLQRWKEKYGPEFMVKPEITDSKFVGITELVSLKKEFKLIKDEVTQLRNVVKKTLASKYLNEQ